MSNSKYIAYRSFFPELATTAEFGKIGIHTRCFFAANTINAAGFAYCKYPPVWLGIGEYNFAAFDRQLEDLLGADAQARFLCMIDLNTPWWLTRQLAYDSFDVISHAAADEQWREATTRWLLDFLNYAEEKYADRIDGYILAGGGTSEWYEYDRGKSSRVKNAAWQRWCRQHGFEFGADTPPESRLRQAAHENVIYDPATESDKICYWQFHNGVIADAVLHFAKVARQKIGHEQQIGVFFGYYMVSNPDLVSFGHLDYERVMASADLDFFISPGTYSDRKIGGGSGSQIADGTLRRYGKGYLHEIDHRTYCTIGRAGYSEAESKTISWFPVWETLPATLTGLKREAAYALINRASLWWFDMLGGWYDSDEVKQCIAQCRQISERYSGDARTTVAQVLLIADPQSAYLVNEKMPQATEMTQNFRNKLSRTGAPFETYSFDDIAALDMAQYRVVCLPATFLITEERAALLQKYVFNGDRTVIWMYAPGICDGATLDTERVRQWSGAVYRTPGIIATDMGQWQSVYCFDYQEMTPNVLRNVLQTAGVHLYVDTEDPIYADARLLAVHTAIGGDRTIRLPQRCRQVIDVYRGVTVAENTAEFLYCFDEPDTALFEIVTE